MSSQMGCPLSHASNSIDYTHYLSGRTKAERMATGESQELATLALRLWHQTTQHLLWFRIVHLLQSPLISQRVFYTIVDLTFCTGGLRVMEQAVHVEGLAGMS